jgi:hypothetical protein
LFLSDNPTVEFIPSSTHPLPVRLLLSPSPPPLPIDHLPPVVTGCRIHPHVDLSISEFMNWIILLPHHRFPPHIVIIHRHSHVEFIIHPHGLGDEIGILSIHRPHIGDRRQFLPQHAVDRQSAEVWIFRRHPIDHPPFQY